MAVQNLRTQKTGFQVIEQSSHIFNKKLLCGKCGASFVSVKLRVISKK